METERWASLKRQILEVFPSVTAAALKCRCHPNALRGVASGANPKVRARLVKAGVTIPNFE